MPRVFGLFFTVALILTSLSLSQVLAQAPTVTGYPNIYQIGCGKPLGSWGILRDTLTKYCTGNVRYFIRGNVSNPKQLPVMCDSLTGIVAVYCDTSFGAAQILHTAVFVNPGTGDSTQKLFNLCITDNLIPLLRYLFDDTTAAAGQAYQARVVVDDSVWSKPDTLGYAKVIKMPQGLSIQKVANNAFGAKDSIVYMLSGTPSVNNQPVEPIEIVLCDGWEACDTLRANLHISGTTGIASSESVTLFKVYPNPTTGSVTITAERPCQLVVRNLIGAELFTLDAPAGVSNHALDRLPAGIYYLQTPDTAVKIKLLKLQP